jgi:Glycosyl transferase family 2
MAREHDSPHGTPRVAPPAGGQPAHVHERRPGAAAGPGQAPTHSPPEPQITAVLCTYNRADRVEDAVRAILAQEGCVFELVVVDDGSTDATPAVLGSIDDDRLRVIRRPNGGLSKARNTGLDAARGRWIVFIDDDDLAEPGWLAVLVSQTTDPTVGIACCGATFVNSQGEMLWAHRPATFGEPFGPVVGSSLAGTFAARTDLVRQAGGYLDGLGTRHQSELFIRMLAVAGDAGLRMVSQDALAVRIEARPPTDRPGVNPRRLYDGTRWILARHPQTFAGQRTAFARYEGIVGTNAARLGDWRSARRRLLRAAQTTPRSPETWGRLALATVPAVGRRVWNRHGTWSTHNAGEVGVLSQATADGQADERELFLAWGYQENPPSTTGSGPGDAPVSFAPVAVSDLVGSHRGPVWRLAGRLARRLGRGPVVVVGCGPGDEPAGAPEHPGLTLCLDLIERVDDPVGLLHRLAETSRGAPVLLSTPDRASSDPDRPVGPPTNPRHRREWTYDQFELLLLSTGFDIERTWHVAPAHAGRGGAPSRFAPRRAVPGRRSSMVFLVRSRVT